MNPCTFTAGTVSSMWPTRCNPDAFESLVRVSLDGGRSAFPRGSVNRLHFLAKADGDLSFWTLRHRSQRISSSPRSFSPV
jgi:hypothetical protein